LADFADVCIRVPETETFKIQELHLPVYHSICMMLEDKFFGEG
jgi:D-sedoheptulose 7-phosphate isomerase